MAKNGSTRTNDHPAPVAPIARNQAVQLSLTGTVCVAGDWHGSKHWGRSVVRWSHDQHGAEAVIHVGDVGFFEPAGSPGSVYGALSHLDEELAERDMMLYWLDGNHEDHWLIQQMEMDAATGLGISSERTRWLPRGCTFEVNQRRWMAWGGARSIDRAAGLLGRDWWQEEETIEYGHVLGWLAELETQGWAAGQSYAEVLLTHEAPFGIETIEASAAKWDRKLGQERTLATKNQRMILRALLEGVGASWVFHGHHHKPHVSELAYDDRQSVQRRATVVGLDMNDRKMTDNAAVVSDHGTLLFQHQHHDFPLPGWME